jgi:FlaA1/EpsC-like NDP-sugar epimerase
MLNSIFRFKRSLIVFLSDILITLIGLALAILLRYGFAYSILEVYATNWILIASTLTSYALAYTYFGLYKGMWRFASTKDLERIFKAVAVGTIFNLVSMFLFTRLDGIPRTLFLIHPTLLILGLGGTRFAYRVFKDQMGMKLERLERVLIIGAGNGGIRLARDLAQNPEMRSEIVGFLDDDPAKLKRTINGVPVLGFSGDVIAKALETNATLIVLAIPSMTKKDTQRILSLALQTGLPVKTLPKLSDVLLGKSRALQLREVSPEDLLGRDAAQLDLASIGHMIQAKRLIVTGAGGSIGSEICRQVIQFNPECLILFELSEFLLYEIEMELKLKHPQLNLITIVGDVRNKSKLAKTFAKFRPHMVIHAAAYKQVPLMERNPSEAIHTNILGTQNVAQIAREYGAERFVMISTDKAVNPTNIMGASKRIAEMVVNAEQTQTDKTIYTVVRFGNVLGSNGSVIPLFKRQIENGGPVTVTHPEITRYFMSIPEACQLVLQSASMSRAGEIFVLDMGEPVKIVDLARQMISMAGFTPDVDIKIEFTGLREGEKLYEELLADDETTVKSHHESIRIGIKRANPEAFLDKLKTLLNINENTPDTEIHFYVKTLVPEFKSSIHDSESLSSQIH